SSNLRRRAAPIAVAARFYPTEPPGYAGVDRIAYEDTPTDSRRAELGARVVFGYCCRRRLCRWANDRSLSALRPSCAAKASYRLSSAADYFGSCASAGGAPAFIVMRHTGPPKNSGPSKRTKLGAV